MLRRKIANCDHRTKASRETENQAAKRISGIYRLLVQLEVSLYLILYFVNYDENRILNINKTTGIVYVYIN